jgi:hypothetical protein
MNQGVGKGKSQRLIRQKKSVIAPAPQLVYDNFGIHTWLDLTPSLCLHERVDSKLAARMGVPRRKRLGQFRV